MRPSFRVACGLPIGRNSNKVHPSTGRYDRPVTTERPPADEMPAVEPGADHPVQVLVEDDRKRSRLTVFFRLLLAIPHFFWLTLWGIAASFVAIAGWFAALVTGRLPQGMHRFQAKYQVYTTRFYAYLYLLANPYPPFNGRPAAYPIELQVPMQPERQSRWKILFRIILGIPAIILAWVFSQVLQILAFLGWFACLAIGRMPKGMRDLGVYCLRYQEQTNCYMLLLTERYPSLAGPTP
jgi:hypothetical protein